MDEGLRSAACDVAMQLRQAGRDVDLVLEGKKMKQVFKVIAVCRHFLAVFEYDVPGLPRIHVLQLPISCLACSCPKRWLA